jgi:general secretion pathway protein E
MHDDLNINKKLRDIIINKQLLSTEKLNICMKEHNVSNTSLSEIIENFGLIKKDSMKKIMEQYIPEALIGRNDKNKKLSTLYLTSRATIDKGIVSDTQYISTLHKNPAKICLEVAEITGLKVKLIPCSTTEIRKTIIANKEIVENELKDITKEEDVNVILDLLISEAIEKRASDIHLMPRENTMHIRFRIDGMLHTAHVLKNEYAAKLIPRIKGLTNMDITQTRTQQDGSFPSYQNGIHIDCRVAIIPCNDGEKVTIRLLQKESVFKDINELGITKIEEWSKLAHKANGLILVCGPTGSGKSTTLYSTIQIMDYLHKSIYTIEDPIEYTLPFITQTQVNKLAGLDFKDCIRSLMRHDPDIIIVGEVRDRETAETCMTLADTGHLVYATLHSNDIQSTYSRLEDLKIDMNKLSYNLRGILVQSLARKICTYCHKAGCSICNNTGYYGRTIVSEFVSIENKEDFWKIRNGEMPYHTYSQDAYAKVEQGITDCAELSRVLNEEFELCNGGSCIGGSKKCTR